MVIKNDLHEEVIEQIVIKYQDIYEKEMDNFKKLR
jgi:hypothetical protein